MSNFRLSRLIPKFLRSDKSKNQTLDKNASVISEKGKDTVCAVLFLDETELQVPFKGSSKGQYLLDQVLDHLNLSERDYFGLRFIDQPGQAHWLDQNKSISSQLKSCTPPYKLYFGVKFYAADPCKLKEEITRYLFFLQVKRDILQGRLPVTFEEAGELCSYAVQSELGDFDPRQNTPGYVSEFNFIPNQTRDLENRIEELHSRKTGLVPALAEYHFLDKAKWLEMYGVDLHPVKGEGNVEYFLGLTPTGIVVYKSKSKIGSYFWPRINKITFKGKFFIIKVRDKNNDEHTYAFEMATKTSCKHLWKCCVEHHNFFRLNQTADRNSRPARIMRFGSKRSYSDRSSRQAEGNGTLRSQPSVDRVASRRQQRRTNSDTRLNTYLTDSGYPADNGAVTVVVRPEPVRAPRHRSLPELQGESPRSTRSAPWESHYDCGLYTSGKESPTSARSDKHLFPRQGRPGMGSDSESGYRRKYFPNRKGSDNESENSGPRRRRRELDSGSESDISYRHVLQARRNQMANGSNVDDSTRVPVLFPFADKENRPNGSIPSLHSAPGGDAKQRRRRRRSKSPGKRPPEELRQHFAYDLIDTEGMSEEQLRDIQYVKVETKAQPFKITSKQRSRAQRKRDSNPPSRSQSLGERDHAPPPSSDPPPPYHHFDPRLSADQPYRDTDGLQVMQPAQVYMQTMSMAPIVKTRDKVPSDTEWQRDGLDSQKSYKADSTYSRGPSDYQRGQFDSGYRSVTDGPTVKPASSVASSRHDYGYASHQPQNMNASAMKPPASPARSTASYSRHPQDSRGSMPPPSALPPAPPSRPGDFGPGSYRPNPGNQSYNGHHGYGTSASQNRSMDPHSTQQSSYSRADHSYSERSYSQHNQSQSRYGNYQHYPPHPSSNASYSQGSNTAPPSQRQVSTMDRSQMDRSQMDRSRMDRSHMDRSRMDHSQLDHSQLDRSQSNYGPRQPPRHPADYRSGPAHPNPSAQSGYREYAPSGPAPRSGEYRPGSGGSQDRPPSSRPSTGSSDASRRPRGHQARPPPGYTNSDLCTEL